MTEPMNTLIIMSDEHTRRMTGCYGHPLVQSPNIDGLANRGVKFQNAYCNNPICVPSRANFITGRYTHETGNWDNAHPYIGEEASSFGHSLISAGHRVTSIGKLHYRKVEDDIGIQDMRLPMNVLNGHGDYFGSMRWNIQPQTSTPSNVHNSGSGETEYIRYDRAVANEAVTWLRREARQQSKPWFLFVSLVTPHFPFVVPEEYMNLYPLDSIDLPLQWSKQLRQSHPYWDYVQPLRTPEEFSEEDVRRTVAAYYGLITFMDEQIGLVLDALEQSGQSDRTRILYTSDHGEMAGGYGLWGKSCMYEDSVGIPMIAAGPDIPIGETSYTNVSMVDLYPSIVDGLGLPLKSEDHNLPGQSIWPIAKRETNPERMIFSEYHAAGSPTGNFMIRDDRFKLIYFADQEYPSQLFDLIADPLEQHDLATNPVHDFTLRKLERALRTVCNPEAVNRAAFTAQHELIEARGGEDKVLSEGRKVNWTRPPSEFTTD